MTSETAIIPSTQTEPIRPLLVIPVVPELQDLARDRDRHRFIRIHCPLKKVRLNLRNGWYYLEYWDPTHKKTLHERVSTDYMAALARAYQIEQRLLHWRRGGGTARSVGHDELVAVYLAELIRRADAGEIDPATVQRYRSALRHYEDFALTAAPPRQRAHASTVNREFALDFAAFLQNLKVSPNGRRGGRRRTAASPHFTWDAVRTMYRWAADPERGNLLPDGFRNPFAHRFASNSRVAPDPFGEPDITNAMAAEALETCDPYLLRLLAVLIFYGLRASEPLFLFAEQVDAEWLRVPCLPQLGYWTKGRRDKRLPLVEPIGRVLLAVRQGLLFVRRSVSDGLERPPLIGRSLDELAREYDRRLALCGLRPGALQRRAARIAVLKDAGALGYDQLEGEFQQLARRLSWPRAATLKDFRHLFASMLAAAGVPEPYRQYLLGHAPTAAPIGAYTHLNRIRECYLTAIEHEWPQMIAILQRRIEKPTVLEGVESPRSTEGGVP